MISIDNLIPPSVRTIFNQVYNQGKYFLFASLHFIVALFYKIAEKQYSMYRIQPDYRTVGLEFSKLLGKLVVKCDYILKITLKQISAKALFGDVYGFFFLIFFIKTYVVGMHLNCIDKSMQFKWVPTAYAL